MFILKKEELQEYRLLVTESQSPQWLWAIQYQEQYYRAGASFSLEEKGEALKKVQYILDHPSEGDPPLLVAHSEGYTLYHAISIETVGSQNMSEQDMKRLLEANIEEEQPNAQLKSTLRAKETRGKLEQWKQSLRQEWQRSFRLESINLLKKD